MKILPVNRTTQVTEMFARWPKDPWPMPAGMHEPVAGGQARKVALVAANQEWDAEGGAIKPPIVPGPKLPL